MKESFALLATLLAIIGNLPYLFEMVKGRVRPHPYTWLLWSLVSGIVLAGQVVKGAGVGALPTLAAELFTFTIFLFSLRYGFKGITRTDTFFLIAALLAIVPWVLTKDPTLSVVMAVGIDLVAFIPTVRKTWSRPETESPLLYGTNTLRHILSLVSLETYNVTTALHSVVMVTVNALMSLLILIRKKRR